MNEYIVSILIGGAFAIATMLVLQFWKKIRMMGQGALAFLLIFIPQAQGFFSPNQKLYTLFGLVCTTIGVIIMATHVYKLGMNVTHEQRHLD